MQPHPAANPHYPITRKGAFLQAESSAGSYYSLLDTKWSLSDIILYLISFITFLACVAYSYNLGPIIRVFPLKLSDKMTNSNSNNFQALWLQTLKCFTMYGSAFVC